MVTIAGSAVAAAGTLIELGGAGPDDIDEAAQGLLRMLSGLSLAGAAGHSLDRPQDPPG